MRFRIPDWVVYALIVGLIYLNAQRASQSDIPNPPPPPTLGDLLPGESPRDQSVLVDIDTPESGVGTAFVVDDKGTWVTARHVVDSCDKVGLRIGASRGMVTEMGLSNNSDTAVLRSKWKRRPLPMDLDSERRVGEYGYFFGFPQGRPGEVVGSLIGRHRLVTRGRYNTNEPILAWSEVGRTRNLFGSLGGLSGAPVLDQDGEVMGVVAAESPRRGRVYSVAPRNLKDLIPKGAPLPAEPILAERYDKHADAYRRERRIAQVICIVN